ncbi:MAG TPA: ABC transporter ATP-binding protein [Rectinemataceae bacterium]|nr:ABC transporter ATP-binding protein [Rectinemataceae bacterium]
MEELDTRQKIKFGTWRAMLRFAAPFKRDFIVLGAMMVAVAAIDAVQPFLTGWAVDHIALAGRLDRLPVFSAIFIVLMAVQAVLVRLFLGVGGRIEMGMNYGIRKAAFDRVQELSFSWFDRANVGWVTARLTSDVGRLADIVAWGINDFISGIAMMLISAVLMLATNWRLGLCALSTLPLLVLASLLFERGILERSREVRAHNSKLTAAFSENIRGVAAVKSLAAEERQGRAFQRLSEAMRRASVRQETLAALYIPLVILLGYMGTGAALWRGSVEFLGGVTSLGVLTAFFFSATRFFDPATDVARVIADLQYAQAAAERVIGLIETEPAIKDGGNAVEFARRMAESGAKPRLEGRVSFEGVSFSYDGKRQVLTDFNLEVPPGTTVALVGETGSGKSTIVNLACRFYEPTEGRILIDGVDQRDLPISLIHGSLGYVLQSPLLFSGSIASNIRYGRLEASDAEVEKAARDAGAHEFIMALEKGYDSQVGEGGVLLSTGQKQLVSLARALIADPAILVLDEATSSVDTETERLVQEAIARVLRGRTSFVIAHRLSTIADADIILVLRDGRVVERGNHAQLMAGRGYYSELVEAQYRHEEERRLFGRADGEEMEESEEESA